MSELQDFELSIKRASEAQDALLQKLLGQVPNNPADFEVTKSAYKEAAAIIEREYNFTESEGVLFLLEQLSRSPRIAEEVN